MQIETETTDDAIEPFRPSARYNDDTDRWESDDPGEASLVLWLNTSATCEAFGRCEPSQGKPLIERLLRGAGWLIVRGIGNGVERVIDKARGK